MVFLFGWLPVIYKSWTYCKEDSAIVISQLTYYPGIKHIIAIRVLSPDFYRANICTTCFFLVGTGYTIVAGAMCLTKFIYLVMVSILPKQLILLKTGALKTSVIGSVSGLFPCHKPGGSIWLQGQCCTILKCHMLKQDR